MTKTFTGLLLVLAIFALTACGRGGGNSADDSASDNVASASQDDAGEDAGQALSSALTRDYEGALPPTNQLILGILRLEGSDDAVTGAQAAAMLALWQALQRGTIQNQAERAAVLRQIEETLTDSQISAIGDMQLTFTDMNDWAEANGIELPQFGQGRGQARGGQGGGQGQGGIFADMSEDERAAFRQEMQNLSPEERRERLQEMGVEVPEGGFQGGGPGGAGGGRFNLLLEPLIELLQSKASL